MNVQTFLLQSELTTRLERTTVRYSTLNFKKNEAKNSEFQSTVLKKSMHTCKRSEKPI